MVAIKKFATAINLLGNEVQNVRLESRTAAPSSPQPGQFWFDAIQGKFVFVGAAGAVIDPTDRQAHGGTQTASTISDFAATVRTNRLDQLVAPNVALSIGGQKLINVADGSNPGDGVNVTQLTGVLQQLEQLETLTEQGFEALQPARALMPKVLAATTENVALHSGLPLIDGVQTTGFQWILLLGQTVPTENGLWYVIPADTDGGDGVGVWVRQESQEKPLQMQSGAIATVSLGDTYHGTLWVYENGAYNSDAPTGTWTRLISTRDNASFTADYVATTPTTIDGSSQNQVVDNGGANPGDRVLLTAQTLPEQNGLWIVGTAAQVLSYDAQNNPIVTPGTAWRRVDAGEDIPAGTRVFVRNGQVYKGSTWTLQDNVPTIGTSPQVWRAEPRALYQHSARIAIHENITLADNDGLGPVFYQGSPFIPGVNLVEGDLVLLLGQTDGAENGLWVAHPESGSPVISAPRPWTRLVPAGERIPAGTSVFVREGENAQQFYTLLYDSISGNYETWQQVPRNRYKTTVDFVIDSYQINLADGYHEFFTPSELPNPPTGLALVNGQLDPLENGIYYYTQVADPLSSPFTTKYTFSRAYAYDLPQEGDLLYAAGGKGMTRGTLWVQQASLGLPQTWGIVNRDVYEGYITQLPLTDFGAAAEDLDMAGFRIINLATATANDNAVNLGQVTGLVSQNSTDDRAYADSQDDAHSTADRAFTTAAIDALTLSDLDPPSVDLDINAKKLTNVAVGTDDGDAVNVGQLNTTVGGISMALGQVQSAFLVRQPARAVATANLALHTAPPLVDGVQLEAQQWILLVGQTNPAENGLWYIPDVDDEEDAPGGVMQWRRRRSADNTYGEFVPPLLPSSTVSVVDGTAYEDTLWILKSGTYGVPVDPADTQTWAPVNVARALATGTQLSSTISDFDAQVRTSRLDQLLAPAGDLSIGQKLTDVTPGTDGTDAVNVDQLTAVRSYADGLDTATRAYADGLSTGDRAYTDSAVANAVNGTTWRNPVRIVLETNVPYVSTTVPSGSITLDGTLLANGDRVALVGQTNPAENGVYDVSDSAFWTRSADFAGASLRPGLAFLVREGTYAETHWAVANDTPITPGTTPVTFVQINAPLQYTAGAGLVLNNKEFALASNIPRRFASLAGDGTSTNLQVAHGLATRDVVVSVYYDVDGEEIECGIQRTNANTLVLSFAVAPAADELRCVVIG